MKPRSSSVWWWVWRAGAALALGVVTTLGLAYGGAVLDSSLDFGGYGDGDLYMLRQTNRWWDVVSVVSGDESNLEAVARVRAVQSWEEETTVALLRAGNAGAIWPRDVILIGWPARCLWGAKGGAETGAVESLVESPEWLESMRYVQQPLPTGVWWPGMAADVALFGGAWMALLTAARGVRGVRAWRRGRRGLCVGCGYDSKGVAGGICPECGAGAR